MAHRRHGWGEELGHGATGGDGDVANGGGRGEVVRDGVGER